jgi:hypothetical protein
MLCMGMAMAAAPREVLGFNFGWLHHLGPLPYGNRTCGKMEQGVNYGTGGTMINDVSDPAVCCDMCAASPVCIAWDLDPENDECWLKVGCRFGG